MSQRDPIITIYGALWCHYCIQAKRFLDDREVPYTWVDVDAHPNARKIVRKDNTGKETVPTLVFPDGAGPRHAHPGLLHGFVGLVP
jgi:mycoredoxin